MQGQQKGTVHGCQTNVALPYMPLLESARVDPPAGCVDHLCGQDSVRRIPQIEATSGPYVLCILRCRRHGPNAHGHCQEDKAEQGQGRRMQLQAGQASCVYCISAISDQDVSWVGVVGHVCVASCVWHFALPCGWGAARDAPREEYCLVVRSLFACGIAEVNCLALCRRSRGTERNACVRGPWTQGAQSKKSNTNKTTRAARADAGAGARGASQNAARALCRCRPRPACNENWQALASTRRATPCSPPPRQAHRGWYARQAASEALSEAAGGEKPPPMPPTTTTQSTNTHTPPWRMYNSLPITHLSPLFSFSLLLKPFPVQSCPP